MKLAFKKGLSGNEEGDRDIEDLADEDSDEDEEGDMIEETKEEAEEESHSNAGYSLKSHHIIAFLNNGRNLDV